MGQWWDRQGLLSALPTLLGKLPNILKVDEIDFIAVAVPVAGIAPGAIKIIAPFLAEAEQPGHLRGIGRGEEALTHSRRALEIYRSSLGDEHRDVGIAYSNLATGLRGLGRVDEAAEAYKAALESLEGSMGRDYWVYGQVEYNYGVLLRDEGRFADAEPLMVRGYENVRDALGAESRRALTMVEGVVKLYDDWGNPDQADAYRALLPDDEGR